MLPRNHPADPQDLTARAASYVRLQVLSASIQFLDAVTGLMDMVPVGVFPNLFSYQ